MTDQLRIAVNGAAGRMGQRIAALTIGDPELQLAAALEYLVKMLAKSVALASAASPSLLNSAIVLTRSSISRFLKRWIRSCRFVKNAEFLW
jgi:dihydrodipicolinate reductase